ncbi:hypothetical protein H2204_003887 [Knufia peltigerae]|uniref:Zn(2)-C6 fungal-type domain-containing protein n=1 Tax=Knufia peltigerae TaxID=1002370 RepID=A0AA39CZZ1_9EURO|nr:hypothetical protein H2204_003887 [Knufia peltigerae]
MPNCDLKQPECDRCTRIGRKCPGYRDESDLLFHVEDQASFVESSSRDRRRRRGAKTPTIEDHGAASHTLGSTHHDVTLVLPSNEIDARIAPMLNEPARPLTEEWNQQVFSQFSNIILPAMQRTTNFGFLTFLPAMVVASGPDSPVGLVFQAMSFAFRCTGADDPEALSRRATIYGRALNSTNAALRDLSQQTRDETVTAVWLLSLYELIVGSSPPKLNVGPATWSVHTKGMATLLHLRGTTGFDSTIPRHLFWLLFNSVVSVEDQRSESLWLITYKQIRCLVAGCSCPPESFNWLQEIEKHIEDAAIPVLQMSLYGCYAAALCEKVRKFVDNRTSTSLTTAFEILEEMQGLQTESYELNIPRPDMYGQPATIPTTIFPVGPRTTFARTLYSSYKLKFLLCVWELFAKIQALSSGTGVENLYLQYQENVTQIQTVADEILATAPTIRDKDSREGPTMTNIANFWADGIRLLYPLRLLAFWPVPRTDQRRSAVSMLLSLRDAMGLQQATQVVVIEPEQEHGAALVVSVMV